MTCKYKVKIKDIQYNYKVQMTDIQSKYKFKVFCTGYDDSEIKEKIDAMYQAWPKVSGEGETITLNDTANTTMAIDLKGNTSQETTTGKNKLPYPYTQTSITSNGVTYTAQSDGGVLVNGTSTGTSTIKLYGDYLQINNLDVPGKYLTGGTNNVILRAYNHTGNSYTPLANDNGNGAEIDTSTYSKCYIELYVGAGTTVNNERIYPMVVDSLSDRTYEKYTGGNPAPNPDYPQAIANVTGTNTIKIVGKNLWGEEEHGGIDESTGQDIYNANRWRTIGYINVTPNTSYTISSNASSNIWNIFYYYDINKTFIRSQAINGKEVSATTPSNCFYMRCVIGDTNTTTTTQRQLEKGTTASTYEAYQEQSYTINLGSIELCKIDNYKDRIYPLNGKWYLEKKIGKVVLSQLTWVQETSANSRRYSTTGIQNSVVKPTSNSIIINMLCNIYIKNSATWSWNTTSGKGIAVQKNGQLIIFDEDYTNSNDLTNFTTMLGNKNAVLYYPLATPTTEEITDSTLISQLEEIKEAESYSGQTNISQTNDDKPFILTAKALKDLSSL